MEKIIRTPTSAKGGITPAEKIQLDAHTKKWIANAMRTDSVVPSRVYASVKALYKASGLKEPRVIVVPSPIVMAFAGVISACTLEFRSKGFIATHATHAATYDATDAATDAATRAATHAATYDATDAATYAATRAATYAATYDATYAATRDATYAATDATRAATDAATRAATHDATYAATYDATDAATDADDEKHHWLINLITELVGESYVKSVISALPNWWKMYQGGNMWSAYDCYLTAMRDVIGLTGLDCWDAYAAWESCTIEGGFRIMHKDFCMVSDRPRILLVDAQNRPHCDGGPSHQWRDGWSLYHIHGIRVAEQIVMHPESITLEQIKAETNAEVRRIMVERFGHEKYLRASDAKLIDSCGETHKLKGLRTANLWSIGDITMLDVLNSTPEPDGTTKRYVIPVDGTLYDGKAGRSCVAASASTWRKRGDRTQLAFARPEDYAPQFES